MRGSPRLPESEHLSIAVCELFVACQSRDSLPWFVQCRDGNCSAQDSISQLRSEAKLFVIDTLGSSLSPNSVNLVKPTLGNRAGLTW
jgi:hypothetical protein